MSRESLIICIDNSEWMRNGDFHPTRLLVLKDTVNMISNLRIEASQETSVGVISMAGKSPKLLVNLTHDLGKILNAMAEVSFDNPSKIIPSIQIAKLCFRNRVEKSHKARIALFHGSPISESKEDLMQLGKELKKANIALDIISIGESQESEDTLKALYSAANNKESCSFTTVPFADVILSSWLMENKPHLFGGSESSSSDGSDFGKPPEDSDLAMAIRMSIVEAQQNQAAAAAAAVEGDAGPASGISVEPAEKPASENPPVPSIASPAPAAAMVDDEDEELRRALAISRMEDSMVPDQDEEMDPELAYALALSQAAEAEASSSHSPVEPLSAKEEKPEEPELSAVSVREILGDKDFLASLCDELNVSIDDPVVQERLNNARKNEEKDGHDVEEDKESDKESEK